MGKIIGESITFDDVTAGSLLFRGDPEPGQPGDMADKDCQAEYSYDECRNGHGYRTQNGNRYGKTGWYRYYS